MSSGVDSTGNEYTERTDTVLANNYGPAPLTFTHAEGAYLIASDGQRYLDFGSGISVTSFGQGHPKVKEAVIEQLDQVWHTSNLYYTSPPLELAGRLVKTSFAERVFFSNSGAEANEAAIKLVRKASSAHRPESKRNIITFEGGFHGRTLTTVTATAQPKYQQGFEPLPGGFKYCEFNNVAALKAAFDDTVCGVMFEPVQGEGGIHVAEDDFVREIRRLADKFGAYVIVDEVQSGVARTGRLWAHEWYDSFVPDVLTSAKALGGGLPIGATLIGSALENTFQPGSHGSTFGGNPVCCSAALAVLELATDKGLLTHVQEVGHHLETELAALNKHKHVFKLIRGRGLMLGAELVDELKPQISTLVSACREQGLLVLQAGTGVLRLLPPLTVTKEHIEQMVKALGRALDNL